MKRLALALLLFARAAAAEVRLEDVMTSVDRHYPLLAAARRDVAQAEGDLLSAQGGWDPTLSARAATQPIGYYRQVQLEAQATQYTGLWGSTVFAGYRWGDDFPIYYGDRLTKTGGELRAGINVPLWRNGPIDRVRAAASRGENTLTAASLSAEQLRIQYKREGALRYWEWVGAGHRRRVAEQLLQIATSRDAAIAARVERGDVPAVERTDNERVVVQRQGLLVSADRLFVQTSIELSLYLRAADGKPWVPDLGQVPALPEPTPASSLDARAAEEAVQRRPEARRLEALARAQRIDASLAGNQRAPQIDAFAIGSVDLGDARRDSSGAAIRPDLDKPVLAVGLVLDIPIPNRAALGRQRAAEAAVSRTEEQQRFARDRIVADVSDAKSAVEAARQRVLVARREVALAAQLEAAERQRFDAGDSTILFVNLRETATAESRVREIDALVDHQRALAQYEAATATQR